MPTSNTICKSNSNSNRATVYPSNPVKSSIKQLSNQLKSTQIKPQMQARITFLIRLQSTVTLVLLQSCAANRVTARGLGELNDSR